jgi:hypothetical protein
MFRVGSWSLVALWIAVGCAPAGSTSTPQCASGKCDTPGFLADRECEEECGDDDDCFFECRAERAEDHCEMRREDAQDRNAFLDEFIRWGCKDPEGVTREGEDFDDRGQDYCEYFAVVQPPRTSEDGEFPDTAVLGRLLNRNAETTAPGLELNDFQIDQLKEEPDAVMGQCIFTAWHDDVEGSLPSCQRGDCEVLEIPRGSVRPSWMSRNTLRFPFLTEHLRMKLEVNSNFAAVDLIDTCLETLEGDPNNEDDVLHDPYMRGCTNVANEIGTEARQSDPAICAVIGRLRECGCGLDTDGDGRPDIDTKELDPVKEDTNGNGTPDKQFRRFSRLIIPRLADDPELGRGFPLGTWTSPDELPDGCRYLNTGDNSKVLVGCDLTAEMVRNSLDDVKDVCAETYGKNVVVHVPIPTENVVCFPDADDSQYASTCSPTPWMVNNPVTDGSCVNRCNQFNSAASCQCNQQCLEDGDCCEDFEEVCR